MRTMILAAIVAAAWAPAAVADLSTGALAKVDDEPTYTLTVQMDNV